MISTPKGVLAVAAKKRVDLKVEQCIDRPTFAQCDLIVKAKYCNKNIFYAKFCCASCLQDGQLGPNGEMLNQPPQESETEESEESESEQESEEYDLVRFECKGRNLTSCSWEFVQPLQKGVIQHWKRQVVIPLPDSYDLCT